MSMISAQADELRKAALVQGAHAHYDVASLLTDAADTILSLRDRAQELQAENDKLREDNACLVKAIRELHSVKLEDRLVALENENDRLRELVDYMTPIAWYAASERERNRLRELGVEADG